MKSRHAGCTMAAVFAAALTIPARANPSINKIQNNYSYILPGMPNAGIAQGSIFDIFGNGLATAASPLQGVPLSTSLSGTSVAITVSGVTTHAILYFVSPAQIAAILPSATPVGTGQIAVTLNGVTGGAVPITVVPSAFGLDTLNGAGNGPLVAQDMSANLLGLTNAANPDDFITLWGTGLGAVTGDETMAQTPVNLAGSIPLEVDIGGQPATIQYAGRSQYPGLDQINVYVPFGVSGCRTSVVVRSGSIVSNFGTIPVAAGGRVCADPVGDISASQVQTLMSQDTITLGGADFVSAGGDNFADAQFFRFTNTQYAVKQPGFSSPFNDCLVFNYINFRQGPGLFGLHMVIPGSAALQPVALDAGPSISLATPSGSGYGNQVLPNQDNTYLVDGLMATGSQKGTYTFTGNGGADIDRFSAQVSWPGGGHFTYATPGNPGSVTRSAGLAVTWNQPSNTEPGESVSILGFAFAPNTPWGAEFQCSVPLAQGQFTIPPAVLLALPSQQGVATPQAQLEVALIVSNNFSAGGADISTVDFISGISEVFSYE